jgi:hypothetical protein
MGQIPVNQSQTQLRSPLMPRATGEGQQRDEVATKGLVGALDNATDVLAKVQDTQEHNAAQVYATEQLSALKDKADQDPNFKNGNEYATEMDRIGQDAAKNITNTLVRNDFMSRYKIAANSTLSGINNTFRDRQLKAAQADLLTGIDAQQESYFNATYPQEKMTAAALIKQSIEDNVKGMVISPEEGVKLWDKISADLPAKDAMRDIGKDPTVALQRLQTNSYGIKDEGKRAELIADAERAAIREQKMQQLGFEQAQEQTAVDLTSKLWDGSLTLSQIQDEMNAGTLERKDAEYLRKAILSDRTSDLQSATKEQKAQTETKQAETYMNMWDMILKKGKATDKRQTILKEFSDGNLRKEDAIKLYTGYLIPNQGGGKVSLAEAVAAEQAAAKKNQFIAGAIRLFRHFWNQANPIDEGDTE